MMRVRTRNLLWRDRSTLQRPRLREVSPKLADPHQNLAYRRRGTLMSDAAQPMRKGGACRKCRSCRGAVWPPALVADDAELMPGRAFALSARRAQQRVGWVAPSRD